MNNERLQEILINNFKKDFKEKLGKGVKIVICNKWQNEANFTTRANMWAIIKAVFDYTGWRWVGTYIATPHKTTQHKTVIAVRNEEKVFRRGLIDYILINNDIGSTTIGKETNRDHTTILNSVKKFELRLEEDYYTQKIFNEIMADLRVSYPMYKNKTTLKIGVVGENI